ncbi:unnamed protein product, partial [Tetraodon nigroviridis]
RPSGHQQAASGPAAPPVPAQPGAENLRNTCNQQLQHFGP